MFRSISVASLISAMTVTAALAEDTSDAGQIAFNTHCRQCHSMTEGDNRLGPSLYEIYGAKAGQVEGFTNYSRSLQENITWDEATLDTFIADPKSLAPSTTMIYAGLGDAGERKKILDFLKANGQPKGD